MKIKHLIQKLGEKSALFIYKIPSILIRIKNKMGKVAKLKRSLPIKTIQQFLHNSYSVGEESERLYQAGYVMDPNLTDTHVQVYYHPEKKKAYVVHRGTQGWDDWITDLRMIWGDKTNHRWRKARRIQKEAERFYGRENVVTLGHSLGGNIAETVGKQSNEVITYNQYVDFWSPKNRNKNTHRLFHRGDVVGINQWLQPHFLDEIFPHRKEDYIAGPLHWHSTSSIVSGTKRGQEESTYQKGLGEWARILPFSKGLEDEWIGAAGKQYEEEPGVCRIGEIRM